MLNRIACFIILLIFISCEKPPGSLQSIVIPANQQGGVFILNEGGFNNGNASLSFYDYSSKTLTDDVFSLSNKRNLGDVLQSMIIYNGSAFLVVNNSKKIEIIDPITFLSKGTITGFNSPRYMVVLNSSKAYVSDLYESAVSVVDLNSNSVSKKINCPAGTEQMLFVNDKVYVSNVNQNCVYVIDGSSDVVMDSIHLSFGSNSLVLDQNNKIWVLCSGDQTHSKFGGIYRINPANDSIEFSINNIYPAGIFGAFKLCINGTKDRLYWLNSDIQSMSIYDTLISQIPFVKSVSNTFYGIGVDSLAGEIYVSDAMNFAQKSNVIRYNTSGNILGVFKSGINTNGFYFYFR